ncbi:DUF4403 family protein [Pontibacter beigongshangensis]|uniref:DUF4403 family protein n=1 Tax=Pontibacter beigongshangensis TaxID=2574733 RepID=UPI00164EF167|nr:DUF4403 family protein [Pontibacter beigongshangensis]
MENLIRIHVPISVSYPALEGVLKQQMQGEYIPKPQPGATESPYAQILDVGIAGSSAGANTIILHVKLRILRTIMKRDQVDLYTVATVGYDNASQHLFVRQFKVESKTTSSFYNIGLETLVNKVAYNQIIQRTRVSLKDIISAQLQKANALLKDGLNVKGLKLLGAVEQALVQDIALHTDKVTLTFELQANVEAEVFDLVSLMPPKKTQVNELT